MVKSGALHSVVIPPSVSDVLAFTNLSPDEVDPRWLYLRGKIRLDVAEAVHPPEDLDLEVPHPLLVRGIPTRATRLKHSDTPKVSEQGVLPNAQNLSNSCLLYTSPSPRD